MMVLVMMIHRSSLDKNNIEQKGTNLFCFFSQKYKSNKKEGKNKMSKEDLQLKLKEYEQDKKDVDARIKSLEFSLYISKQNQEYLKKRNY